MVEQTVEFVDHKGQMLTARQLQQCACAVRLCGPAGGAEARGAAERGGSRVRDDVHTACSTPALAAVWHRQRCWRLMELRCAAHLAFLVACHHNIGTTTTNTDMKMSSCLELRGALLMMTCLSLNERALKSTLRRRSQTHNHFTHHGDEHRAPKEPIGRATRHPRLSCPTGATT